MDEKTLADGLDEILIELNIDKNRYKFFNSWPVIAGVKLSSCTKLNKVELSKKKIYVSASSLSSKSLLIMEKNRIIKDWNNMFPNNQIKDILVVKGY